VTEDHSKAAEERLDQEIDFMEDPETYEKKYNGRLSPYAKE
jgi:hypothetical protein